MREVISYNRDYLTGKWSKSKKNKENIGVKGKVKLQLFDAKTNKKVTEAYTENLITDLYFKDIFLSTFVQGIMGVGNTRGCSTYDWFNYLYLTDHDKPENMNEQRILGNIIGYAHRNETYSGDDRRRGTINQVETKFEVTDNKIKINFVFDFPTHAANGKIESIYWGESDLEHKDYFYQGPCLYGRENEDNSYSINSSTNKERYWAVKICLSNAKTIKFISPTKGWILIDGKNTGITQSSYTQFPEKLKGHWVVVPFDLNINPIIIWDQAVSLLNSEGNPLVADSRHSVRKYDYLKSVCPYVSADEKLIFIGYYIYSKSGDDYLRIYKWSKVGVQLNCADINMNKIFKDKDYDKEFQYESVQDEGAYLDGCIDIVGYTYKRNDQFGENTYTSRWIRIDEDGHMVQDMNIKPKIGNSKWFEIEGMNSGNIERRARINKFYRSKSRIYLSYIGEQGGSNFYQAMTPQGNLLESYRKNFEFYKVNNTGYYNILGTDRWISSYNGNYGNYILIQAMLTSRPIGAHTKLTQPVEKTEANTMKIQYMFEIDLIDYGQDYY